MLMLRVIEDTREYIYLGNQPIGLITKEKPKELLQIHTDHLGTPRAVTSKDKTILWRWEGDQFGDTKPQIQTITLPLRHAGQYKDDETGLFYNWHRFYIPELGRYNRVDPLGLTDGTNPFNYVGGSPLVYIDPNGLFKWEGAFAEGSFDIIERGPVAIGMKFMHFTLRSDCDAADKKYVVTVLASGLGGLMDWSVARSFSFGSGKAELDDNNGNIANPNAFNGFFFLGALTLHSYTYTSDLKLGNATGNINGWGLTSDIGAAETFVGFSMVRNIKEEDCGCKN